jgi:hypothetical protein
VSECVCVQWQDVEAYDWYCQDSLGVLCNPLNVCTNSSLTHTYTHIHTHTYIHTYTHTQGLFPRWSRLDPCAGGPNRCDDLHGCSGHDLQQQRAEGVDR